MTETETLTLPPPPHGTVAVVADEESEPPVRSWFLRARAAFRGEKKIGMQ